MMYGVFEMNKMMRKWVSSFLLGFSFLALCGCGGNGVFRDRGNDYKMVAESQSLVIPKGVPAEARSDEYYIPEKDEQKIRLSATALDKSKHTLAVESRAKVNEKRMAASKLLYSTKLDPKYAEERDMKTAREEAHKRILPLPDAKMSAKMIADAQRKASQK